MPSSWHGTAKRTFSKAFNAKKGATEIALDVRREQMNKAWEELDKHSKALTKTTVDAGITTRRRAQGGRGAASEQEILRLNVGGTQFHIGRRVLAGKGHLGNLFEMDVYKVFLPTDEDGFIFLDFSPKCMRYVLHTLLSASGTASGTPNLALGDDLPADEQAYLSHVASVLDLEELFPISAVLEPNKFGPISATILDWCPGEPAGLELIYRASRDGWAPRDFHARCGDDSRSTITLYRVSNTGQRARDSIIGGFSSVPWTPGRKASVRSSPGAFVFMLKDGTRTGSTPFQPEKWEIRKRSRSDEILCCSKHGPWFGRDDLWMSGKSSRAMQNEIVTSNRDYRIPDDHPFLDLDGQDVVEMETYRVCYSKTTASRSPPRPGLIEIPTFDAMTTFMEGGREADIHSFGVNIADALLEEKTVLHQAHTELTEANVKAGGSLDALSAVCGPDGWRKVDDIMELNVRGTRMTTFRSTLQVCPQSALAAQFDKDKWPPTEKDLDDDGWRLMDCSPSVFSKVLDVLRMRKQVNWTKAKEGSKRDVKVEVEASDWSAFKDYVDMQFPGCAGFVMDFVVCIPEKL
eukprot:g8670.t1